MRDAFFFPASMHRSHIVARFAKSTGVHRNIVPSMGVITGRTPDLETRRSGLENGLRSRVICDVKLAGFIQNRFHTLVFG